MPRGDLFIVMLLLWTFVGMGVDGERVTGVLNGQVELRGRYGHNPDVGSVEWTKYSAKNSTKKLIYVFTKPNNTVCTQPCQNIRFNSQNMSLTLVHLTPEDEGIYEEKAIFKNNSIKHFNVTLSLECPASLVASNITVSFSLGSLILKCEINCEFKLLKWLRNGLPLPDDQRFSLTENNTTMQVSNLTSSDCEIYTCQVTNENGISEVFVSVRDKGPCQVNTFLQFSAIIFPVGLSLICLLVLCIILIYVCKYYGHRKIKATSPEEPVYDEPISPQEEAATPTPDLLIVYQDIIKPNDSHQSEDFGYSTIAYVLENMQPSQTT
ncbi:hepatocyte cell adhesion molecule [Pangasianodon hypophthalmus]|uniref:hepatocyte cell adhesion molecule n=1 Tax=Pangasianodon hypophthalmus TaxID=310915 RepID=UPI0023071C15|nr:hepatocyte cell adhesion molecule [Pangasianodon hypophthalmus]